MAILTAIALGVIQGLTEFLPVSSSGHLILAQKLFGLTPDLFTNVALHFGTLFAVCVFYRKQILGLIKKPFGKKSLLVIVATLPTVAIALLFKFFLPAAVDGVFLPIGFAVTIVIIFTCHCFCKPKHNLLTAKKTSALVAGIVQGISVLPGVSRSGSTICTLKMLGIKDKPAAELSFLMSIPVILGSIVFISAEAVVEKAAVDFVSMAIGVCTSAIVGFASLKMIGRVCEKGGFAAFGIYLFFPLLLSLLLV